ncbi:hypothetical protein [Dokdonella soli]|uniref:Phage holin family protein n=1 Tax=Dokdonella soli TaxID=529810 RepID=A0ABN1IPB0_9GAMM
MDKPEESTHESPHAADTLSVAGAALVQAMHVAEAAWALLRAELRLARSSALVLVGLAFVLVLLGVGTWLATNAAIAAGIYELTGHMFYGIGGIALANLLGVGIVLIAMRGCWRDLSLPRTRRVLGQIGRARA